MHLKLLQNPFKTGCRSSSIASTSSSHIKRLRTKNNLLDQTSSPNGSPELAEHESQAAEWDSLVSLCRRLTLLTHYVIQEETRQHLTINDPVFGPIIYSTVSKWTKNQTEPFPCFRTLPSVINISTFLQTLLLSGPGKPSVL
ncbi:hypothetical protein CHARACLAT_032494 [Characodon lateralis]|uniref:Uncharacterized protein n=1 Tax=Characodon lateralis TaxID=208331 RepID=A0ABU7DW16_9TELE|nr:hypothetical protein [Characodon lateralis]